MISNKKISEGMPTPASKTKSYVPFVLGIFVGCLIVVPVSLYVIYNTQLLKGETSPIPTVTPTESPTTILPSVTVTSTIVPTEPEEAVEVQKVDYSWIEPYQDTKLTLKYSINLPVSSKIETQKEYNGIAVKSSITFDSGINLVASYVGDGMGSSTVVKKRDITTLGILQNGRRLYRTLIDGKYLYFTEITSMCGELLDQKVAQDEACVTKILIFKEASNNQVSSFSRVQIDIDSDLLPSKELDKFDRAVLSIKD